MFRQTANFLMTLNIKGQQTMLGTSETKSINFNIVGYVTVIIS